MFLSLLSITSLSAERHFWYELEALYWQPWEKSAVVANRYSPVVTTSDFTERPVIHPHFPWDWGFRLGVGAQMTPPTWKVDLYWTNFSTALSQEKSANTNDAEVLNTLKGSFPIWDLSDTLLAGDYISNSYLRWKLSVNLLDLDFDRPFCWGWFSLSPHVGLRSAWLRQTFDVEYSGGIFSQTFISPGSNINGVDAIKMRNNYWGLGPRIGLSPCFDLGAGFTVFGDAAIASLLGQFHLTQKGEYLNSTQFHRQGTPFGVRWALDAAGGFGYQTSLFKDQYDLSLKLSYEFHEFYHQMELKRDSFGIIPHDSNLSLQGVVAHVRMDF